MVDRERLLEAWNEIWQRHPGKVVGMVIGFLFGLAVIWLGLLWTLFLTATTWLGYWIGTRVDAGMRDVPDWLERVFPTGRR